MNGMMDHPELTRRSFLSALAASVVAAGCSLPVGISETILIDEVIFRVDFNTGKFVATLWMGDSLVATQPLQAYDGAPSHYYWKNTSRHKLLVKSFKAFTDKPVAVNSEAYL